MTRDSLRDEIGGVTDNHDMLYRVTTPRFVAGFTVYNGEITGCAPILKQWCNGTALWAITTMRKKGWKVEHVEDRRQSKDESP